MSFFKDLEKIKTGEISQADLAALREKWSSPPADENERLLAVENSSECLGAFSSGEWFSFLSPHVKPNMLFQGRAILCVLQKDNVEQLARIVSSYNIQKNREWASPGISSSLLTSCVREGAIQCFDFFIENQSSLKCFNLKSLSDTLGEISRQKGDRVNFLSSVLKAKSKKLKSFSGFINDFPNSREVFNVTEGSSRLIECLFQYYPDVPQQQNVQNSLMQFCLLRHEPRPAVTKEWQEIIKILDVDLKSVFEAFVKNFPNSNHVRMLDLFSPEKFEKIYWEKKSWPKCFLPYRNHPTVSRAELLNSVQAVPSTIPPSTIAKKKLI